MGHSDSADVVGMDVDTVHGTGNRITGRSSGAAATAKSLKEGLDAAHAGLGHPSVRGAMRTFIDTDITHHANHLGADVTAAGHHVSNVASTARSSDDDGAAGLDVDLATTEAAYGQIDQQIRGRQQ